MRSRIRLTRALATLVPALANGALLYGLDQSNRLALGRATFVALAALVLLVYAAVFFWKLLGTGEKTKTWHLVDKCRRATYEKQSGGRSPEKGLLRFVLRNEPCLCTGVAAITLAGVATALSERQPALAGIPGGGLVLTAVSGWAWWRIWETQAQFLVDYARRSPGDAGPVGA